MPRKGMLAGKSHNGGQGSRKAGLRILPEDQLRRVGFSRLSRHAAEHHRF